MKIEMKVKIININREFIEEYDIDNSEDPWGYAQNLIDNFNSTLRPNESPRELLNVRVVDKDSISKTEHNWEKQNLVTLMGRNGSYDKVQCVNCGITAKRYGLDRVVRDSEYRAKIYDTCESATAQLKKLNARRKERS